jgi:hypothetical protein
MTVKVREYWTLVNPAFVIGGDNILTWSDDSHILLILLFGRWWHRCFSSPCFVFRSSNTVDRLDRINDGS